MLDSKEQSFHLPGLQIEKITAFSKAVQYDLSLDVKVHTEGTVAQLMYRKALFERITVERLIEEWAGILLEMIANPGGAVVRDMGMPHTIAVGRKTVRPSFTAPRSELEQRLAQIWQEVLQIDRVGVDDEFFELGGHSLLALRLFTRIEQETGTQLPLSTLFEKTTIASLALMIDAERSGVSWDCLIPIQPKGDRPPVFLVHGIGGGVLGYRDLTNAFGDDRPFLGLQAAGQDGREAYDLTVKEMASRYIGAMRAFQPQGPYRIGGYCFGGVVAYEMACQLSGVGEKVSLLALFESSLVDTADTRASLHAAGWCHLEKHPCLAAGLCKDGTEFSF